MAKYDGPAFFRKKGVDFKNPEKLGDGPQFDTEIKNRDFTPAIEKRTQKQNQVLSETSKQLDDDVKSEVKNDLVEDQKPKRFKLPRDPFEMPEREIPTTGQVKKRHQIAHRSQIEPLVDDNVSSDHDYADRIVKVTPPAVNLNENDNDISATKVMTPKKVVSEPNKFVRSSYADEGYHFPSEHFLPDMEVDLGNTDKWVEDQMQRLNDALLAFDVDANVVDWTVGPTVTQFEIELGRGVKVNKITNLTDDLKLQLAARDIRIEAPIPGKNTVGIEVPNLNPRPVPLSEIIKSDAFRSSTSPLTIALGVDLFGEPQTYDLRKMPHGLIAGATGSGKSVFINSVLISLLYKATPQDLKLLLIDPKTVELAPYNELPHLLAPVISDPKAASASLKWVTQEMDNRYERLAAAGARNIEQFNKKAEKAGDYANKMPYIVVVIDELADLMMVSSSEVQDYIVRITQKARAAGIHLLIATQRPSVDVVTGLIKNNIPTRVAFMVSSQVDSRTILDYSGAERLLGRGDMLFLGNGKSNPIRLQGAFIDEEIDDITDFVREQGAPQYAFNPTELKEKSEELNSEDDLMNDVLEFLADEDTISTSKLQRMFSIGYNRAATIIDQLEKSGYISDSKGSKPREVFYNGEDVETDE